MASVMGINKIGLPKLSENMDPEDARALRSYLYQLQEQLQRISRAYPAIPSITPDGVYGNRTKEAVQKFQSVFGLPVTGVVDFPTWYKISDIYVAVSRIAELR